jgi:hypothetical protein
MKSSPHTKLLVAGLAMGALWLAAPAGGAIVEPPTTEPANAQATSTPKEQGTDVVVRRDGDRATPFVANVTPATNTASGDDGFDWGYAAIGAGVVLLAAALLLTSGAVGGRRTSKPAGAVPKRA